MSRPAVYPTLFALLLVSACGPGNLPPQKIGKPYVIGGQTYYPAYDPSYDKTGIASWYGPGFHGKYTASGEVYDQNDLTAAHPTLPMPSLVRVTNLENGKSLVVRVNDRGPFSANRLIDLSKKSARTLGISGLATVRVQFLEQETQNYIEAVKQNDGKIISMAEYNRRAAGQGMAADAQPPVAAPVLSVARSDNESRGGPVHLIRSAAADEIPSSVAEVSLVETQPAVVMAELEPAAAPPPIGGFTVQAGVFSLEENAQKLASRFSDALVDQVQSGSRMLWRVTVGEFSTEHEAHGLLSEVRAVVADARVVRR